MMFCDIICPLASLPGTPLLFETDILLFKGT